MYTELEPEIVAHLGDGKEIKFIEYTNGLYQHDVRSGVLDKYQVTSRENVADYLLIQTVEENKILFTRKQMETADGVRELSRKLGRPSKRMFEDIISKYLILNCPYTLDDVKRVEIVYSHDIARSKGHTTTKPGIFLPQFPPILLPENILKYHLRVTISVDIIYIQGYTFLITYSPQTRFRTVTLTPSRSSIVLLKTLREVLHIYQTRGFEVIDIHADSEFEPLRNDLLPILLHTVAKDDHVGDIENSAKVIKEDTRTIVHELPFKKLPKTLLVDLVKQAVRNVNLFPHKNGISPTLSPMILLTSAPQPDFNNLKLGF